jgi:hypothetical protein
MRCGSKRNHDRRLCQFTMPMVHRRCIATDLCLASTCRQRGLTIHINVRNLTYAVYSYSSMPMSNSATALSDSRCTCISHTNSSCKTDCVPWESARSALQGTLDSSAHRSSQRAAVAAQSPGSCSFVHLRIRNCNVTSGEGSRCPSCASASLSCTWDWRQRKEGSTCAAQRSLRLACASSEYLPSGLAHMIGGKPLHQHRILASTIGIIKSP